MFNARHGLGVMNGSGAAVRTTAEVGCADEVVIVVGPIAEMIMLPTTKIAKTANMIRKLRCALS